MTNGIHSWWKGKVSLMLTLRVVRLRRGPYIGTSTRSLLGGVCPGTVGVVLQDNKTIRFGQAHLFTEKKPDELCVGHSALFLSAASCHGSAEDSFNHTRAQS